MLHPGQAQVMDSRARFKVVACGRRWGKTELGKTALLLMALRQGGRAWWLAPTILMASQVWRDLKASLRDLPYASVNETEKRIDIAGGGMIAVRSAHHPDSLRGEGLDLVALDEAAFMQPRVWHEVVRPMLLTTRGSAIFLHLAARDFGPTAGCVAFARPDLLAVLGELDATSRLAIGYS